MIITAPNDIKTLRRIADPRPPTTKKRNLARELSKAEDELTAAWAFPNEAKVRVAEARVNQLWKAAETAEGPIDLHAAAHRYASLGYDVFPLAPGTKIPIRGSSGFHQATRSADLIDEWWGHRVDYNIGLRTGYVFDVIDVDGFQGQLSLASSWDECFADAYDDRIALVSTPRPGGMHIYIRPTARESVNSVLKGIDYKARGGYVVAPPSRITATAASERAWHPGTYEFRT